MCEPLFKRLALIGIGLIGSSVARIARERGDLAGEVVVNARWPTVQDIRAPRWSRALLKMLSAWRYAARVYAFPKELRWAQQFISLRKPKQESL